MPGMLWDLGGNEEVMTQSPCSRGAHSPIKSTAHKTEVNRDNESCPESTGSRAESVIEKVVS